MRIGLFGGSFDPIHWGHVLPVLDAAAELGLDRVLYLPTGRPPHKPERELAPALARYTMTEMAVLEFERLWVSSLELSETAPSYTIDTLLRVRVEHPDDELHLLIGSDSLRELTSWHRFEAILETARIAVLERPGVSSPAPAHPALRSVRRVANRTVEVSSTDVRRLLARGERPPEQWVPGAVVDFALKYRLYR